MSIFQKIAEERIRQAMEAGELDNLPGAGRPLVFEDDRMVPEDLRMAYRVLRNSGFVPPELELKKEIHSLRELIGTIDDDRERLRKIRELNFTLLKFNEMRKRPIALEAFPEYEKKFREKAGV